MTECAATDGERHCPYPAAEEVLGIAACYFHAKVVRGEITDAGPQGMGKYRELRWNPIKRKGKAEIPQPGTLDQLVREWAG